MPGIFAYLHASLRSLPPGLRSFLLLSLPSFLLILGSWACTPRERAPLPVPPQPGGEVPDGDDDDKESSGGGGGSAVGASAEATLAFALTESVLNKNGLADAAKKGDLSYKVTYEGVTVGPYPLTITNGTAVVTVDALPAAKTGDLKVEILVGDQPKLTAQVENVSLEAKKSTTVDLDLQPVTGAAGSSGRNGSDTGTKTSTGTGTGTGSGTGSGTRTGTGTSSGTGSGTGTGSSSGSSGSSGTGNGGTGSGGTTSGVWDGKSDVSHGKWIVETAR